MFVQSVAYLMIFLESSESMATVSGYHAELRRCRQWHLVTATFTTPQFGRPFGSGGDHLPEMAWLQQMRWSPTGAHLFLQVRTQVLNNDLATHFKRWYPGFTTHHSGPVELAA
jgi:hypothetical protein